MRFKVKPDPFYSDWSYVYFKKGWWPFWRNAGWTHNSEVGEKVDLLKKHERYL